MNVGVNHQPAQPFFLKAEPGERFCIYYPPVTGKTCLGAFIYIHPFAEEMNKSRRMVALQARAMADSGYAVLQLDLYGCGDSSGDFADARWGIWLSDIAVAERWLLHKFPYPIGLWGLRLGAVLALDYAKKNTGNISTLILWQPVINTGQHITQFLRLALAGEMFVEGKKGGLNTKHLRSELAAGKCVEIAGYELSPMLTQEIELVDTTQLVVGGCPVHWFEIVSASQQTLSPAGVRLVNSWKEQGIDTRVHTVSCVPFWATQETTTCPELIEEMDRVLAQDMS